MPYKNLVGSCLSFHSVKSWKNSHRKSIQLADSITRCQHYQPFQHCYPTPNRRSLLLVVCHAFKGSALASSCRQAQSSLHALLHPKNVISDSWQPLQELASRKCHMPRCQKSAFALKLFAMPSFASKNAIAAKIAGTAKHDIQYISTSSSLDKGSFLARMRKQIAVIPMDNLRKLATKLKGS
jgi:hypothetical protein